MEKLGMHTPNMVDENIEKIAALFPNVVTEVLKDGKETKAIDFDLLKQELSDVVVEGPQERYQFTWPDKKKSVLLANAPINKTLRPCREESVDFDTTENLYIEGDNLDALKLLQETYLGKVKMIYIDPPYNTGHDFVYEDDFAESIDEYMEKSEQFDDEGNRLVANLESNGRFHTDWLNMMYPRLKLAKNLLSDDGVIFISIDDNEVNNAKKLCLEVFGERNFIASIIWKKRSTPPNDQVIGAAHEYILLFAKSIEKVRLNLRERSKEQNARYKNPDNHPKGPWTSGDLSANVKGGRYVASLCYPIKNPNTGEEHYPPHNGNWRFNREKMDRLLKNDELFFGEDGKGRPKLKRFLCDVKQGITYTSIWDFMPYNTQGSSEMTELFGSLSIFDNPKPTELIAELIKMGSKENSIVMDFFAGSSTTAQAIFQQNCRDNAKRKFLLIQIGQKYANKSEAYSLGFEKISDLGKERIRRAGKKIKEDSPLTTQDLDVGFRVLKIDSSNMKDVFYKPSETQQQSLFDLADNIKEDRTGEDLLFQVMLDLGVDLSAKIETEIIDGKQVFSVDEGYLIACFEKNVTDSTIKAIAEKKPWYAVFRDNGFATDSTAANCEQIFATYSPDTKRKVL